VENPPVELTNETVVEHVVAEPLVQAPPLCRDQARALVNKYAAVGTVWAVLPVPMATSLGLAALETHLIYWVARIYGEQPTKADVMMTATGLELASVGLKTMAIEGAALVPVVGLGVKASIAGSVVLAIGHAVVQHYETKYPAKAVTRAAPTAAS
jgi:uncharacterized protein (DUF697 family)